MNTTDLQWIKVNDKLFRLADLAEVHASGRYWNGIVGLKNSGRYSTLQDAKYYSALAAGIEPKAARRLA